jgi:hypothetical protein
MRIGAYWMKENTLLLLRKRFFPGSRIIAFLFTAHLFFFFLPLFFFLRGEFLIIRQYVRFLRIIALQIIVTDGREVDQQRVKRKWEKRVSSER